MTKNHFTRLCETEGWDTAIQRVAEFADSHYNLDLLDNDEILMIYNIRKGVFIYTSAYLTEDYKVGGPDYHKCYNIREHAIDEILNCLPEKW